MTDFYRLFLISVIPAFIGVFFLFFLRERPAPRISAAPSAPSLDFRKYDRNLRIFFIVQCIFTLGNSSNQFLLLRSMGLGYSLSSVILMYMLFNLSSSMLGTLLGSLSDKAGRKPVLAWGYGLYCVVYSAFGLITTGTRGLLWGFWILYGVYYALTEGVEKAFVAELAPHDSKATALGFSSTIVGIGLLPASVIAGLLFTIAPSAPFLFGGITSLAALCIMVLVLREKPGVEA
jgi:MFS family permease